MLNKKIILLIIALFSLSAFANLDRAASALKSSRGVKRMEEVTIRLVNSNYHFAAIPWAKDFFINNRERISSSMERAIDELITVVGTRQFELVPNRYLKRSNSNSVRYIIAKKLLRKNKASEAISYVSKINPNHPVYPFSLNLKAVALSLKGRTKEANNVFKDCENFSASKISSARSAMEKRQLEMNKDYCVMGNARALFQGRKYDKANLRYLDIPKSSFVWPEVLFEEAWNSYYLKNYNRTLGKLVTYRAPLFDYIFNPEIEVLNALTFMKMCLYDDAKKISDNFYAKYMKDTRTLRRYLLKRKKQYKYFYRLMISFEKNKKATTDLLENLLLSISREPSYMDTRDALTNAVKEMQRVNGQRNSLMKRIAKKNISDVIRTQRNLVGSYVRERLVEKYAELYKAFQGMSYIKLETLAQRKAKLYNFKEGGSKRGDIKYIKRNDKQYFWNFNGEFWADELGDYVFALGSEC